MPSSYIWLSVSLPLSPVFSTGHTCSHLQGLLRATLSFHLLRMFQHPSLSPPELPLVDLGQIPPSSGTFWKSLDRAGNNRGRGEGGFCGGGSTSGPLGRGDTLQVGGGLPITQT